jgi:hypothetical protein
MTLVSDLISRIETRLSQLSGLGVQTYAEPLIVEHLQSAIDTAMDDFIWPYYSPWVTGTLDGTTGAINLDMGSLGLVQYEDLIAVIPENQREKLRTAPISMITSLITGTTPRFIEAYPDRDDKIFRVVPYTSTGALHVRFTKKLRNLGPDTDVKLDDELLICSAVYLYMTDDGTNPAATQVAGNRLLTRERALAYLKADDVSITPPVSYPVDTWWP